MIHISFFFLSDEWFILNGQKVSRACPRSWNRSRQACKPHPLPSVPVSSGKVYACTFFKCSLWVTHDSAEFQIHNRLRHSEAKAFACVFCPASFPSDDQLIEHSDAIHNNPKQAIDFKSYHCGFEGCWFTCGREEEYLNHNIVVHSQASGYPCCFCKQGFPTVGELVLHIDESVTYSCALCPGILTSTFADIKEHVSSGSHMSAVKPSGSTDSLVQLHLSCLLSNESGVIKYKTINRFLPLHPQGPPAGEAETFKCTKCGLTTSDEAFFENHIQRCMKNLSPKSGHHQQPLKELGVTSSGSQRNDGQIQAKPSNNQTESMSDRVRGDVMTKETISQKSGVQVHETSTKSASPTKKHVLQGLGLGETSPCETCSFRTEFRVVKAIHERLHKYDQDQAKTLWCPYCTFSTDAVLYFKIHLKGHTETSRIRLYHCTHCPFASNQVDMVEDHHEDIHANLILKSEVTRLILDDLPCPDCQSVLKTERELLEHLEDQHNGSSVQKYLKEMYSIASLQIVDEKKVGQREVDRQGNNKPANGSASSNTAPVDSDGDEDDSQYGWHVFKCPNCAYSSPKYAAWFEHVQRHQRQASQDVNLYGCKTCSWRSTSKRKVIDHCKKNHTEILIQVKTLQLPSNVEAKSGADMIEEESSNLSEYRFNSKYQCNFCDFKSNDQETMAMHMTLHKPPMSHDNTNEEFDDTNPAAASEPIPNVAEADIEDDDGGLIEDMLLNLDADKRKNFDQALTCPICPYSATAKRNMRRHLKLHQKQAAILDGYRCAYCAVISKTETVITRHILHHHPNLPVKKITIGRATLKKQEEGPVDEGTSGVKIAAVIGGDHSENVLWQQPFQENSVVSEESRILHRKCYIAPCITLITIVLMVISAKLKYLQY